MAVAQVTNFPKTKPKTRGWFRSRYQRITRRRQPTQAIGTSIPAPESRADDELTVVFLARLPDASLEVSRPIPGVVEKQDDDNYVATMTAANLNASGDTPKEALENLGDIITATYTFFQSLDPQALGPEPTRQIRVLRQHIARRS